MPVAILFVGTSAGMSLCPGSEHIVQYVSGSEIDLTELVSPIAAGLT
jgi:hypothetical protein